MIIMKKGMNKSGALEMSIGTLIIIVLGVSMLILGIVLVRSIMCGAIGFTGDINDKVRGELNTLFGSTGDEVQCIGAGTAVKVSPGDVINVYCAVKAPESAKYTIKVVSAQSFLTSLTAETIMNDWLDQDSYTATIAPGDSSPKKAIRFTPPANAPETTIVLNVEIDKNDVQILTQDLDFQISSKGFIRNAIC
jgi:hypothetical protein